MSKRKWNKAVWETLRKGWKVLKQPFNVLNFWVCASFLYTENWKWLQWMNLEKNGFIVHFKENSTDVPWGILILSRNIPLTNSGH